MPTAGQLVSDLQRRVRDPSGTAHPTSVVLDLLDRAQLLFVRAKGVLVRTRSFTATQFRLLYDLDPNDTLRILDISSNLTGKRLLPVQWDQLVFQAGPTWWRTFDDNGPTTWAPVGTRLFALFPGANLSAGVTLTIRDQRRPVALTATQSLVELPDEYLPLLLDFMEALLLLRGRDAALTASLADVESLAGTGAKPQ